MWIPNTATFVCTTIAATAGCVCILKDFMGGAPFNKTIRADGKVVIITGANSGIGKQTAMEMAKRGAKVFMACRNMRSCEEARKEIVLNTQNKYVYCRVCDLSSFDSIREFVQLFKVEEPKLDILINNAGIMRCPKSYTKEGIESQLGVNHMGHFLLTNLLLDHLKKSAPSRIVVVSSRAHKKGTIHKDDLNLDKDYDPAEAYNQSKLANLLFANELSIRLLGTGVTVNSVHPGLVDTNIVRHMSFANSITRFLFYPFFWPFIKTAKYGAQTVLYAALEPSISKTSGEYFVDNEPAKTSELSQDMELSRWLWAVSEKWTNIKVA